MGLERGSQVTLSHQYNYKRDTSVREIGLPHSRLFFNRKKLKSNHLLSAHFQLSLCAPLARRIYCHGRKSKGVGVPRPFKPTRILLILINTKMGKILQKVAKQQKLLQQLDL